MRSREENRRLEEAYAEAMGISDTNLPYEATYDYAGCQNPICALCDAYGDGYTAGKENGLLRGPQLASPAARAILRVQPVYGCAVGARRSPVAYYFTLGLATHLPKPFAASAQCVQGCWQTRP